ncbi:MAG: hypothetical protein QM790_03320 [Nibricoccus sp.]
MREVLGFRLPLRQWLLIVSVTLVLLPVCLYWPTTWTEYGLRDDYGVLREAHQDPGAIIKFCGSHARPIFGWLLRTSFGQLEHIHQLAWARLLGSVCIGLFSASVFTILVRFHGWSVTTAACVSAMVAVVPAAQVVASWSILWPYIVAALLSVGAFVVAERGFRVTEALSLQQGAYCVVACMLVVASVWVYQPNGLFYLVFVAVKAVRRGELQQQAPRVRLVQHLLLLGGSMLIAYVLIRFAFAMQWLPMSSRIAFEHDYIGKLVWFVQNSLPNALALVVLNDFQGRTAPWYHLAEGATVTLLVVGGAFVTKRRGWREGAVWFGSFAVLSIGSYFINLMASERWPSYRTIHPLTCVVLVYAAASMEVLGEVIPVIKKTRLWLGLAFVCGAAVLARKQTFELIALPQNAELHVVEAEAKKLDLSLDQRVYVITPTPAIAPARLLYSDEFGSLSTDSDWVPKEMMKLIFHEQHPDAPPCRSLDHMVSGEKPPPAGLYDVVIDLRAVGKGAR